MPYKHSMSKLDESLVELDVIEEIPTLLRDFCANFSRTSINLSKSMFFFQKTLQSIVWDQFTLSKLLKNY
jgi:hypothetical protein